MVGYIEEEYIQLSALQHFLFCPRQCALAYLEEDWIENELTALGRLLHKKVHSDGREKRKDLIQARGLRLSSARLGLSGLADMVEFYRCDKEKLGAKLDGQSGLWRPFPVEYKHGKPKTDKSDEVQLCAQAICLEEMLNVTITEGAIFYGKNKRRRQVSFTIELRTVTAETSQAIHEMFKLQKTPPARFLPKCKSCSLIDLCLPEKMNKRGNVKNYINSIIKDDL